MLTDWGREVEVQEYPTGRRADKAKKKVKVFSSSCEPLRKTLSKWHSRSRRFAHGRGQKSRKSQELHNNYFFPLPCLLDKNAYTS